ncbi:MAG: hypothetical protein ACR2GY_07110 [Phycisphaerales bacterium]
MPEKPNQPGPNQPPNGQILIYDDGGSRLQVRMDGQTAWLNQSQMADLYQTTKQNISLHLRNLFEEQELQEEAVVKEYLTTAADGKQYRTLHYNLNAILAVGYCVRSARRTVSILGIILQRLTAYNLSNRLNAKKTLDADQSRRYSIWYRKPVRRAARQHTLAGLFMRPMMMPQAQRVAA